MTLGILAIVAGVAVPLYAYFLYPAILWIMGRVRPHRAPAPPASWPAISITVPAYNEERAIASTIEALLALDYPRDRVQILVVSDASTDRTDEIVRTFADRGVELLRVEQRVGKTGAENRAMAHITGEIVVNTDASVRVKPDAIKPLVSWFTDPTVGLASGRDVSVAPSGNFDNTGETGYVGYEMWVRDLETRVSGIVGASGCFYAIRADQHRTLVPEALSRDFASAMVTREAGLRAVSVNDAVCYVPRSRSLRHEFRRKCRTMTRGLETLYFKRHLLNPFRHGLFAWMLFSHKLARWFVPWGLLVAAIGVVTLAPAMAWARVATGVMAVGITLGITGWYWRASRMPQFIGIPAYLLFGNLAALLAWARALRGELDPTWEPTRRDTVTTT